ncbi:hypothetical protein WMY93_026909 [Mugilogobius chulae]|uniref:Apolipoprotein C-II n=1 Tax=Mugilogobius chulae TaxID=88201 RepID=A0AAW0N3C9_9GOBI
MNKLLVITVLAALLAINVEGFRVPRQVAEEEEQQQGTLTKMTNAFRSYYENAVNTASGYLDSVKGMKLEEKAKNFYEETTKVMSTYTGIVHDQIYHIFYQQ